MKLIKPVVEFFGKVPTDYDAALKSIEAAGRTCYKSEDKITATSAEGFVKRLVKAGHLAMVEHSNFVIRTVETWGVQDTCQLANSALINGGKYLNVAADRGVKKRRVYIGGNLTAWAQIAKDFTWRMNEFVPFASVYKELFNLPDVLDELPDSQVMGVQWEICPYTEIPDELHRYSARFTCDRGVSHELVRHRPCSFAQESTRYVDYGGKDIEFIEPAAYSRWSDNAQNRFETSCEVSSVAYNSLLCSDLKPQQARAVLPNALKTEIIVTADAQEWKHIHKLRTAKGAHPDMRRVMSMVPWDMINWEVK